MQQQGVAGLHHDVAGLQEGLDPNATESAWQTRLDEIAEKVRRLGAINLAAIEEYDQQAERRDYLEAQHAELSEAIETLEKAIRRIDQETRTRFKQTFDQVNEGFGELFPKVFGGGAAPRLSIDGTVTPFKTVNENNFEISDKSLIYY